MGLRMSVLRFQHFLLILEGLHGLLPGIIHTFKSDGGAQSIAGFTNFQKSKAEILWAFRIIGVHGLCEGLALLFLTYLSTVSELYSQMLSVFTLYLLCKVLVMQVVMRFSGNGTHTVAPRAPGRWTPAMRTALLGTALYLL